MVLVSDSLKTRNSGALGWPPTVTSTVFNQKASAGPERIPKLHVRQARGGKELKLQWTASILWWICLKINISVSLPPLLELRKPRLQNCSTAGLSPSCSQPIHPVMTFFSSFPSPYQFSTPSPVLLKVSSQLNSSHLNASLRVFLWNLRDRVVE